MLKVLGIEKGVKYDFVDKVTKNPIHTEGLILYLGEERKNVDGIYFDKPMFISNTKEAYAVADTLKVGDMVSVYYNRYGKIEAISK